MHRKILTLFAGFLFLTNLISYGQNLHFDFDMTKPQPAYNNQSGYGYDRNTKAITKNQRQPMFFSVKVPEGDYIADDQAKMYYVSIDPKGRLGWEDSTLVYEDTQAHVIEILTDKASNAYKALLRKLHISYMIVGEDAIDFEVMLEKLKENFHIETLMLGGGGVLNWSFIQQGLCDEVSLVVASAADGSDQTPTLFEMREKYSDDTPVEFALKEAKVIDENALWLRYKVKEVKRHE